MSTPARQLPSSAPSLPSPLHSRPPREPAARPRTPSPPQPLRRARRGFHPAFWIFAAVVVTGMVVALVSLSALVVQTGFDIDRAEDRIAQLTDGRELLRKDVATLSAPGRIASWARDRGLVMPEDVIVLQVPGTDPAGSTQDDG